jgi:periplasmic protein TonB
MADLFLCNSGLGTMTTARGTASNPYDRRARFFLLSFALHVAVLSMTLLLARHLISHSVLPQIPSAAREIFFPGTAGGGGAHDLIPMPKGDLPKVDPKALARPVIVVPNQDPLLPVAAGIEAAPELKLEQTGTLGDPWARLLDPPSNGAGLGLGSGDGDGPGWGHGKGPGTTLGYATAAKAGHVIAPRPLFTPDPEYTDQARRVRLQGTVTLWVVVAADGTTRDIRVARSLGLGLDEKAMEAVRLWRFAPGMVDGAPAAVQVNVEVNFRFY